MPYFLLNAIRILLFTVFMVSHVAYAQQVPAAATNRTMQVPGAVIETDQQLPVPPESAVNGGPYVPYQLPGAVFDPAKQDELDKKQTEAIVALATRLQNLELLMQQLIAENSPATPQDTQEETGNE